MTALPNDDPRSRNRANCGAERLYIILGREYRLKAYVGHVGRRLEDLHQRRSEPAFESQLPYIAAELSLLECTHKRLCLRI